MSKQMRHSHKPSHYALNAPRQSPLALHDPHYRRIQYACLFEFPPVPCQAAYKFRFPTELRRQMKAPTW